MKCRHGLPAAVLLALLATGCGKEAPRTDVAGESKQALERAKEGAFGTPVKALEAAKGMEGDLDKKAREAVDKAEQGTK